MKPLVFVLGVAGIAAAGFTITSRVLDRKPAAKEATALNWSSNSLVPPDNLRAITLETPPSVLGSSVITNQDFTGWVATQQWAVKLEFQPRATIGSATNTATNAFVKPPISLTEKTNVSTNAPSVPVSMIVQPGQRDRVHWVFPAVCLVILLLLIGNKLIEWLDTGEKDSPEFLKALGRWSGHISRTHQTPRSVKRLVNKLRFYAMMLRALGKKPDATGIPENVVVAFGVLEEETNGLLSEFLDQPSTRWTLASELKPDAMAMISAVRADAAVFQVLQSSIRVEPPTTAKS